MFIRWRSVLTKRYSRLVDDHLDEVAQTLFGNEPNTQKLLLIEQKMIGLVREAIVRAQWIGDELCRLNHGSGSMDVQELERLIVDLNDLSDSMISMQANLTDCPLFELRCELNAQIKSHSLYRRP